MDNGLFFPYSFLSLAIPVIAIWSFIRVRRLEQQFRDRPAPTGTVGSKDQESNVLARLHSLERQVEELRSQLEGLLAGKPLASSTAVSPPASSQTSVSVTPAPIRPPTPIAATLGASNPPQSTSQPIGLDIEQLIAGRWLNRIGIVALLVAVSFFLKYAFDNDWIGPRGQVALGLLSGAAVLIYSQWLLRLGHDDFSNRIAGLGGGVLYLSLFAGANYYHLFPPSLAFGGMAIVTATLVVIAVRRDSQAMALVALLGGLLTPVLLSTGRDAPVELFTYLALLNVGVLLVAHTRHWSKVEWLAFAGTMLYFWGWWNGYYHEDRQNLTLGFASVFFLEFALLPVLQARRAGTIEAAQTMLVALNALGYLAALHRLLYAEHRWSLSCMLLLLAALHLVVARRVPTSEGSSSLVRMLFGGLALMFVTLVIPVQLDGKWMTMAWAIEGAILIWVGVRAQISHLRWAGVALFAVVASRLMLFPIHGVQPVLLNQRFGLFAVVIICFVAALRFSRSLKNDLNEEERLAFGVVGLCANIVMLWALSCEVWDYWSPSGFEDERRSDLAQQLGLSLLWTTYATALVAAGVRWRNTALRWQGLALLGLVAIKVFLYDLSSLEAIYRIVSFMVFGLLLLGVSFFYQRASTRPSVKEVP